MRRFVPVPVPVLALALLLALGSSALAKEPRAIDAPNDDGRAIAVIWPASENEEGEVVISIAARENEFIEAARVPAAGAKIADIWKKFGLGSKYSTDHAVILEPLEQFPPQVLVEAALGDERAAAQATVHFGPEAIARTKAILGEYEIKDLKQFQGEPRAVDDVGREVILDRPFHVKLELPGRPPLLLQARPQPDWLDFTKLNNLVVLLIVGGAILAFINIARRNPNLYLRRIGGLDAIDEALGRATEMGKPVLFVHGLETLQKVPTIAAVNILGEVAKKVARYDTKILCTNYDPIVLTVSQETVKEGFLRAGRPDAYNPDDVFMAGADQFSYVAAVDGIMLRQKPAANIYAGYFYAESLLLAETGAQTGAIQIAATDAYTQLPFFVTTCDYTLMGEELYAASAYLSRDPMLLGSLRGQDVGKALVIAYIILGTAAASAGVMFLKDLVRT